ncbi:MAG: hypothetical protein ACI8S6_001875, partial [Myxococcota bacterium]
MSDFTFCAGDDCPLKADCYRCRRLASGRRVTFTKPPYDPGSGLCPHFMEIVGRVPSEAEIRERAYHI